MEVVFIEHTSPDNLIKSKVIGNVRICRKMLLCFTEDAFERGNHFEVRIEQ